MAEINQQFNNDDEILIMDESGEFKVLSEEGLKDFQPPQEEAKPSVSSPATNRQIIDTGMEEKMLQPPPPVVVKKTASFYFDPADEEEAAKHKLDRSQLEPQKRYSLDKIVDKIKNNYQLSLEESGIKKLRAAIFNYLRDRRSYIDTELILRQEESAGGLNLQEDTSDHILDFLKEIKDKVAKERGLVVDEVQEEKVKKNVFVPPSEPVVKKEVAREVASELKPIKPLAEEKVQAMPASPPGKVEVKTPEEKPPVKPLHLPESWNKGNLPRFQRPVKEGTKRLTDVKKDYKLVGPIEEMRNLTLETFRRLGEDTKKRSTKVLTKIDSLSKDSLARRASGISAWRQSPLYRMYLAIGQASMEYDMDIKKVIEQYAKQGRLIMTPEEFEAISDINKQLRF